MLRIENLLLRGDGQVAQGRMLEETSLVQGQGGQVVENGGAGSGSGSSAGGGGGSVGAGPTANSAAANGHHESALGALGATDGFLLLLLLLLSIFAFRPGCVKTSLLEACMREACSIMYV